MSENNVSTPTYKTVYKNQSYTLKNNEDALSLTGTQAINGTGNDKPNFIEGNNAANILDGKGNADTLYGGLGNDLYIVDNANDYIDDSIITDATIDPSTVDRSNEINRVASSVDYTLLDNQHFKILMLTGSADINGTGNQEDFNYIKGNSGNNILTGFAVNETLDGGAGHDTLNGSTGNDTYVINDVADVINEPSGSSIDTVVSSVTYTLGSNLENLTLTGKNTTGTGNDLANTLISDAKNTTLTGGNGAASFIIKSGSSTITNFGGLKGDSLSVSKAASASVTLNSRLDSNNNSIVNNGSVTIISNGAPVDLSHASGSSGFKIVSNGTSGILISGSVNADTIIGGLGNDTIQGYTIGDIIDGGKDSGSSQTNYLVLNGNLNNPTDQQINNIDQISIDPNFSNVDTGITINLANQSEGFTSITGGMGDDTITGGKGNDTLLGSGGSNTFNVLSGKDTILDFNPDSNDGDTLHVASKATATIVLTQNLTQTNHITLDKTASLTILLNYDNDITSVDVSWQETGSKGFVIQNSKTQGVVIIGSDNADSIVAGAGGDTISSGLGNDTLIGGSGSDTFVFDSAINSKTNVDKISGFTSGQDTIELLSSIFGGTTTPAISSITDSNFISNERGSQPNHGNYNFLYSTSKGTLSYDADGAGHSFSPVVIAILGTGNDHPALKASDLSLV